MTRNGRFVVGGWTEPQRSRKYIGSLLVGYYQGDQLVFAGGVGTGFNQGSLRKMLDRRLRQPVFLGVRDDKAPRDVTREGQSAQGTGGGQSPGR